MRSSTPAVPQLRLIMSRLFGILQLTTSSLLGFATESNGAVGLLQSVPPLILTPPQSQSVDLWQSTTFNVAVSGDRLSYQWRENGILIRGATNATFYLNNATTNLSGAQYSVVVGNSLGSVTSAPPAVLTVNQARPGALVFYDGFDSVQPGAQGGVTSAAGSYFFQITILASMPLRN